MPRKRKVEKYKGVYEKHPGSGIWWIRYTKDGKRVTESIGSHSNAVAMIQRRMTEMREGVNLPNRGGRRGTRFSVLVDDALKYSGKNHKDKRNFRQRLELANVEFGKRVADSITPLEIADWLEEMSDAREWESATYNRVKAAMSKAYKLGLQNSKVFTNPARLVAAKTQAGFDLSPTRRRSVSEKSSPPTALTACTSTTSPSIPACEKASSSRSRGIRSTLIVATSTSTSRRTEATVTYI